MSLDTIDISLVQLRKQLRQARRALSEQQQSEHAQAVMRHLLSFVSGFSCLKIGVTAAFDGEIDPLPASHALQAAGHQTYLPILRADKHLDFALWQQNSVMVANQFGILEPQDTPLVGVEVLDVLLVPLVGVDRAGNRLGMGGGYYDRTLGRIAKRPYLIGIAHACQCVNDLPVQSWDIPLDALITETKIVIWHEFIDRTKQ